MGNFKNQYCKRIDENELDASKKTVRSDNVETQGVSEPSPFLKNYQKK